MNKNNYCTTHIVVRREPFSKEVSVANSIAIYEQINNNFHVSNRSYSIIYFSINFCFN
jgi:hypothetical protein